jgi:hypothetical protein
MDSRRHQFTIRGLLLITALVSVVLAFAVRVPLAFQISLIVAAITLVVVMMLKSASFATSERRPRIAAISWTLLALFFALFSLISCGASIHLLDDRLVLVPVFLCASMTGCCLVSVCQATRAVRHAFRPALQSAEDGNTRDEN